jgi:tRNA(fMet)-specific endonuclease VapC
MLRHVFDTDHVTLFDHRHAKLRQRLLAGPAGSVGVSPVTIQEYLKGRLAALSRYTSGPLQVQAYANLGASVVLFQQFPVVAYDAACENRFQQLRSLRLRVGTQDLKIAAVALTNGLIVLTRNRRDFGRVPGLVVDDWSA